jgi:hypothetical protein
MLFHCPTFPSFFHPIPVKPLLKPS